MEPPPFPPYLTDPPEEPIYKSFYFNQPNQQTMSWQPTTKDVLIMLEPRRFSCAIVESTSIIPSTVPLPTKMKPLPKRMKSLSKTIRRPVTCLQRSVRRISQQFFESINPKNDFKSNEDLEEYLYNKSLEIQPKGLDTPTAELKPKHNASTLRSPGVKPPKAAGNHYSANHPIGLHLHSQNSHSAPHAMSSQSSTVPNTPLSAHETKRSLSHNQDDAPLQQFVDIRFERKGTHPKIPVLQPPPLLPRSSRANQSNSVSLPPTTQAPMPPAPKSSGMMSTATSPTTLTTTTTPSSAGGPPPKLHPRRMTQQPMSPLAKSPLTPSRDNSSPSAFQFPVVYEASTAPPLPPRPSTSSDVSSSPSTSGSTSSATKENQEQLRVIFDREESHSPTVRLSVPLPPALPPPRGSSVFRAPPPLPPKSNRHNSNSPTLSSEQPFEDPMSPSIFVNTPPPPLPPKTYRSSNK